VTICAGAVVIGGLSIGDNCIVGANAVVLDSVPSCSIAVGVPARVLPSTTASCHL
jgi:serine O-acetyltransferase